MAVIATHNLEQLCCGNSEVLFQPISHPSRRDTIAIPALPSNARARPVTRSRRSSGAGSAAGVGGVRSGRATGALRGAAADAETWAIRAAVSANPRDLESDVMTPRTLLNFLPIPIICLTTAELLLCGPDPRLASSSRLA